MAIVLQLIGKQGRWIQAPTHTATEAFGGAIALAMAYFLYIERRHQALSAAWTWVIAAFLCMGTIDVSHALAGVHQSALWVRALGTFLGGLLFVLVCLPPSISSRIHEKRFFEIILILSLGVSLALNLAPDFFAGFFGSSFYTRAAAFLQILGGVSFLMAAAFFLTRRSGTAENLVFANTCLLFAVSGIFFPLTREWGPVWWFAHVLRLGGYSLVMIYSFRRYWNSQDELRTAYDKLELKVAQRTAQLERERNYSGFLAEAGQLLASSLDPSVTLKAIADLLVPRLADWCMIDLVRKGNVGRVAVVHHDPEKATLAAEVAKYDHPRTPPCGPCTVIEQGQTALAIHADSARAAEFSPDNPQRQLLESLGFDSYVIVPIKTRTGVKGALTLVRSDPQRAYAPEDVPHFESLAERIGLALENSELYEDAQRAIHAREEFVSIASHELKTPLTAIKLHIDLLRRLSAKPLAVSKDALDKAISGCDGQVHRLDELVEDLLDVTRIGAGKLQLRLQQFDLAELVGDVLDRFETQLQSARSEVTRALTPGVILEADPFRIEQVLTNLITNAMKYAPGKPIEFRVERVGDRARLDVTDQGPGIQPDKLERIFSPYDRGDAEVSTIKGLGLGLYISRQIIEAHRGKIRVESAPGKGAHFIIELPLRAAATGEPSPQVA